MAKSRFSRTDRPTTSRDSATQVSALNYTSAAEEPSSGTESDFCIDMTLFVISDPAKSVDELECMVLCCICTYRVKDTAFQCGHIYCEHCAKQLEKCAFGCKDTNGKPFNLKYRVYL